MGIVVNRIASSGTISQGGRGRFLLYRDPNEKLDRVRGGSGGLRAPRGREGPTIHDEEMNRFSSYLVRRCIYQKLKAVVVAKAPGIMMSKETS